MTEASTRVNTLSGRRHAGHGKGDGACPILVASAATPAGVLLFYALSKVHEHVTSHRYAGLAVLLSHVFVHVQINARIRKCLPSVQTWKGSHSRLSPGRQGAAAAGHAGKPPAAAARARVGQRGVAIAGCAPGSRLPGPPAAAAAPAVAGRPCSARSPGPAAGCGARPPRSARTRAAARAWRRRQHCDRAVLQARAACEHGGRGWCVTKLQADCSWLCMQVNCRACP